MSAVRAVPYNRRWPPPGTPLQRIRRDEHGVAFVVAGADGGFPVVVLHGGPGSGSQATALRFFDLARFRVVLVDQRGAGMSTPRGSLRHNRTDALIEDLEAIREWLSIERWGVVGGSWGATLALAYAGSHPNAVTGVVVRGLFLSSGRETRRLFITSRKRKPRAWRRLCEVARCSRPAALLACCARTLRAGRSVSRQQAVAQAWRDYEEAVLASANARRAYAPLRRARRIERGLIGKYRIQAHYLMHHCWLGERRVLRLAWQTAAAGVPIIAVHGTRDPVCPVDNVRRLVRAVGTVRVERVRAGHLASDPALGQCFERAIKAMFSATR